jgi:PKD repeat protein
MKKTIIATTILLLFSIILNAAITTTPAGKQFNVGQTIGFDVDCYNGMWNNCSLDFGDGSQINGLYNINGWHNHYYTDPGTYTVRFHRATTVLGTTPTTCLTINETLSITILENRSITSNPTHPIVGRSVTFTAINFNTPANIGWHFGDGTTLTGASTITHTYSASGTYLVQAYDWNGDTSTPVNLSVTVGTLPRTIIVSPAVPRVDQTVYVTAQNFGTSSIDWNFGDGATITGGVTVTHRYQNTGAFTISAREAGLVDVTTVTSTLTVLPENRSITASSNQPMINEKVTFTALNFRGRFILWNFGDGSAAVIGSRSIAHGYAQPGRYTVVARDERGVSSVELTTSVHVVGITDQVGLLLAELTLDNGKVYKVIPKNSKAIKGILRMKMRGTGIVSGNWIVDDRPLEFFSHTAHQGQIVDITTSPIPGLPVQEPGLHTLTVRLLRPSDGNVTFPILKYFVQPYENLIVPIAPLDSYLAKEAEIPEFSWQKANDASYYQIAFSSSLLSMLENNPPLNWIETKEQCHMTPDAVAWNALARNRWIYWKVRGVDALGNPVAESPMQQFKIIVPEAVVSLLEFTDIEGRKLDFHNQQLVASKGPVLVKGQLQYAAAAEYLILRVFVNQSLSDQLLFRDILPGDVRRFETSITTSEASSQIDFQVAKSSAQAVVIGSQQLLLKQGD